MTEEKTLLNLSVTPRLREILNTVVTWARIVAIVNFVSVPFDFYASLKDREIMSGIIGAVVTVILNVYLINFSSKVKRGLDATDQQEFNDGIDNLRKYFRLVGIFIILLMVAMVVMMLWVVSTGSYPRM